MVFSPWFVLLVDTFSEVLILLQQLSFILCVKLASAVSFNFI